MGLFSRLKADTEDQTPKADEDLEEREIRVTVFPTGGGRPYIRDVTVEHDGMFELEPESGECYKVARGSVWQEGTTERAIVHEDVPQTIGPGRLDGDGEPGLTPNQLHGVAENNFWIQLDEIARRKSPWKQGRTWAMLGLFAVLVLLIIWQIHTIGDGFEQLADALRNAEFARGSHQDISPNG